MADPINQFSLYVQKKTTTRKGEAQWGEKPEEMIRFG
jgi:hypothetical protein